ncbi:hypothetical protein OG369_33625 [Streptomyces sp. NBC_01221]|nr:MULTISPECIES: hypothetical protein [unclassified Streptomyces]MCX4790922.1 hypothetical protein [Streptomyces sp. NBC_01221]WSP60312.1 hypothetical protein OG306_35935 [Streptomyces sp. NBC_01241]WSP67214.1 hypothetical protein OG466_04495 [Streptomyces sp. NBC_01240]
MVPDASPRPRMQHVTTAGTALAVTLAPLVIGVLLAKTMAADPMGPVNAMVTRGGQPVPISPAQWRRCGRQALRSWKAPLNACRHPGTLVPRRAAVRRPRRPGALLRER